MAYKYEDTLNANDPKWFAEAKAYLDKGKQIAVANLTAAHVQDCIALTQEHDFTCAVEDKDFDPKSYEWGERPRVLGFVHRDKKKRISIPT